METAAKTRRQKAELEVAKLKILRFSLEVIRMDKTKNKHIRGTARVGRLGDTSVASLRWFGHVKRRNSEHIGRSILEMGLEKKSLNQREDVWI